MEYVARALTAKLLSLAGSFPVIIVSGARQVGKSTLLAHALGSEVETVVFDPVLDIESARSDPELFLANHGRPLVLDEIQYAPELTSAIKRAVDRNRKPGSFFLSGSQQWSVMKGLSDSLAGRAVFLDLEAFSIGELATARFWLEAWLEKPGRLESGYRGDASLPLPERFWRGWMPETQALPRDLVQDYYRAYMRTYIERDARSFSAPQDLQSFGSFVRLVASQNAQEIQISALARELGVSAPTVTRWLDTLAATFQFQSVPAFAGNLVKRITGKPKGILREIGLAAHLLGVAGPASLADSPARGSLFEALVVGEIRKAASLPGLQPILHHWRSVGGAEVDLVLEWNGTLYPIEIKLASNPSRKDTSGLAAFRVAHPSLTIAPGLVVCCCEKPFPITADTWAMPWDWVAKEPDSVNPLQFQGRMDAV